MIQYFYNQDGDYDPNNPDNWSAAVSYYSPTGGPQPGDTLYIADGGYPGPESWTITPSGGTWNLPANVTVYFSGPAFGGYLTTVNFGIDTSAGGITIYSDSETTWTAGGSCRVVVNSVGSIFNVDPGNGINGSSNTQYYGNITSGITDDGSGILGSGYSFGGVIQWNSDLTSSNAYNAYFTGAVLTVTGQIGNDVGAYFDPATIVWCNTILDGFWNGSTIYQSGDPCTWLVPVANISNPVNAYVTPVVGSAPYGSIIINNPYVPGGNFQIYFPAQGYVTQSSGATFSIADSSPYANYGTYVEATTSQVQSGVSFGPGGSYTGTYSGGGGGGGSHYAGSFMLLKQNSSNYPIPFFLESTATPGVGVTGLSPTVQISKAGGSFGSPAGAVSEVGNGWYLIAGNATDTNTLGALTVQASGAGAITYNQTHQVVSDPENDAVALSTGSQLAVASSAAAAILVTPTNKLATDSSGGAAFASASQTSLVNAAASAILSNPSNKLATDSGGNVSLSSSSQSSVASAAATAAATAILATPSHKLATDSSGNVTLASASQSSVASAAGTAAASAILGNPSYKLSTDSSGNVSISAAAESAIASAVSSSVAPAVSSSVQSGLGSTVAGAVLLNPSNKLATDGSGYVTTNNPATTQTIDVTEN